MKRRTALGTLAILPVGAFSRRAAATSQTEVLTTAEFTDKQNATHRLSELTRPLLLVNLWAAWCAGCMEELPTIQTLVSRLAPDAIDVVLLSHGMNWHGDVTYAREARLPFRHWRLSARASERVEATAFGMAGDRFGLPQSFVFAGRERVLVASHLGSRDWADPGQLRQVRSWLNVG